MGPQVVCWEMENNLTFASLQLQKRLPSLQRPLPRRHRRRQLLFWDKETQISREKFEEQLQTGAHCWEYVSTAKVTLGNRGMRVWLDF